MKTDIAELTSEKLEEISQRYRKTEVPKCHICGAEMTIQRMSSSRITYGCAGAIYDETGCHYVEGRSLADDHYAESRITVVDVSDPDVLELVEALEKAQLRIDEMESDQVRQRLANAEYQLYMAELAKHNLKASRKAQFRKRRAAEKRIAELESRTVSAAAADVLAERQRQVTAEGWSSKHDDQYKNTELAFAASCYAFHAAAASWDLEDDGIPYDSHPVPKQWPWDPSWWKPTDARRDLVKAGALILAEIERIDRAAGIKVNIEGANL
ncbi:TPA: ead/Ea22-like family protein [Klebsiella michiganensis]|nr:ead/Ea22-like family protein [Klebsiella michiganensis]HBK4797717.1 ead/Ea22-like family protein [Klebsiella michiganensis]HDS5561163.1 ead/Ea22-like family protein [Klebsiella michiganensis]